MILLNKIININVILQKIIVIYNNSNFKQKYNNVINIISL